MTIKVYKVADIVGGFIIFLPQRKFSVGEIVGILTKSEPTVDPLLERIWKLELMIGEGEDAQAICIDLPPLLAKSDSLDVLIFLDEKFGGTLIYFCNRLFASERPPGNESEREEIVLQVKKAVYEEEAELSSLRAAAANLEAAVEFQRSGPRRDPIPEHVKLMVWARDGGACGHCGSTQNLHFDHIIPVSRGGGNSVENIQILCQACNLRKSDKIGVATRDGRNALT